jgi:hypothetical protein
MALSYKLFLFTVKNLTYRRMTKLRHFFLRIGKDKKINPPAQQAINHSNINKFF